MSEPHRSPADLPSVQGGRGPWLFGRTVDLAVFGGTTLVALVLASLGPDVRGGLDPEWSWIVGVMLVDVAHVWSTAFIVYLDPVEWKRRKALYVGVPLACFATGVALFAIGGALAFWRVVAYLAVFHFIRQQYGWVMLYRARNGEHDRAGRLLDSATIYLAALYPVVYWHAHLPRTFAWMKQGDFVVGVPAWLATSLGWVYVAVLAAYVARAFVQRPVSWGKHLVVATTAACWYVGIVATDGDYTFTVTNVFVHGIPYLALVYVYARNADREATSARAHPAGLGSWILQRGAIVFFASLWLVAYVEELIWDRAIWHDRSYLFGDGFEVGAATIVLVPLLATPQLAHYVLDAFLWRRRSNPRVGRLL